MPPDDHDQNSGFLEDAKFIFDNPELCSLLAATMRKLAGRDEKRARAFSQIKKIIEDFRIYHARDFSRKGNEILSELLREIVHNDLEWPIAPFLAWMCSFHPDAAAEFYRTSRLAEQLGVAYRVYNAPSSDIKKVVQAGSRGDSAAVSDGVDKQTSAASSSSTQSPILKEASAYLTNRLYPYVARESDDLVKSFIGRDRLLLELNVLIREGLKPEKNWLLALHGPTGVGKSSIAAEWCRRWRSLTGHYAALHMCVSTSEVTTDPAAALEYLRQQVLFAVTEIGIVVEAQAPLMDLLAVELPEGFYIAVWLDGIDEVTSSFQWFLPVKLGRGICVNVSFRGDYDDWPVSIKKLLRHPWVDGYELIRIEVPGYNEADIKALLDARLTKEELAKYPESLAHDLYSVSGDISPLLSANLISEIKEGKSIKYPMDRSVILTSSYKYVRTWLSLIEETEAWSKFDELFKLVLVVRQAVTREFCNRVLPETKKISSFSYIPPILRRWLREQQAEEGAAPSRISFSARGLAQAFRANLSYDVFHAEIRLVRSLLDIDEATSEYALRHLPSHMIMIGAVDQALGLINSDRFMASRQSLLGDIGVAYALVLEVYAALLAMKARGDDYLGTYRNYPSAVTGPLARITKIALENQGVSHPRIPKIIARVMSQVAFRDVFTELGTVTEGMMYEEIASSFAYSHSVRSGDVGDSLLLSKWL